MHNAISMKIFNPTRNLKQKFGCFFLIKGSSPQNLFIKIVISILHHKKNLLFTDMIPVSRQNIGMLAVQVYFHLLYEKLQLHLLSSEAFQSHDDIIDIRNSEDDLSCLTFPQSFQHLQFILRLFSIFQLCNFFQCFVHVLQFIVYVQLFLEMLAIQLYGSFVFSQFTANVINVSNAIDVTVKGIFLGHSACMTLVKCR